MTNEQRTGDVKHSEKHITTRQVDKWIASGESVTLYSPFFRETITVKMVSRDRHCFTTDDNGRYDRSDYHTIVTE